MPERAGPRRLGYDAKKLDELLHAAAEIAGRGSLRVVLDGADRDETALVSERLAQARRLKVERVDLGRLTADGIGRTEKALRELFRRAEVAGALLLFDEADALFGRRSHLPDVQERYAKLEKTLLSALRRFPGPAVIAVAAPLSSYARLAEAVELVVEFQASDFDEGGTALHREQPGGPRTTWDEPLGNRHFLVIVGDLEIGFCQVSGLTSQNATVEAGRPADVRGEERASAPKAPGPLGYANLVLRRGLSQSKDLYHWRRAVIEGKDDRRTLEIWQLPAPRAKPVNRWRFLGCWPCRWSGPDFDALGGSPAFEEIELCYDRFDWL